MAKTISTTPALLLPILLAGPLAWSAPPAAAQEAEAAQETPRETSAPVPRPAIEALRIDQPIDVDGRLDEEVWERAPVGSDFVQREPNTGAPATERTEVRVVYTGTTLYIGIMAFDSAPDAIVAEELERDGQLFRDDSILILLDTFDDDRNAYWFETNPNGARTDALVTDEGRDFNIQWDGIWASAGARTDEGWSVELGIPFSTLRFQAGNPTWGLNVRRLIRRKNEEVFWSPIPLEANLFRVSMAGELRSVEGVEPGLNLRIKPFVVGADSDLATTVVEEEEDVEAGLDVKWGLTRNVTLDLTYNTDFAETEVDAERVNLTRFSLFFPEKREFFLENAGIFEFGFPSPIGGPLLKPFFSRRIGISPFGTEVPIDWGGRITGRSGPWSFGVLDVQTDRADLGDGVVIPEDNWGVARVTRNVGRRSTVGAIFTHRDSDGPGSSNTVYGLDGNFNPTRRLNLGGFVTQSDGGEVEGDDDWAAGFRSDWQGAIWGAGFDALQIGDDYNPEAGFLLRRGIRRYTPRFTFEPRPEEGIVRNYRYSLLVDVFTDLDDETESVLAAADLFGVRFQSEDEVTLFGQHRYERLLGPFGIAPGVVIPPGSYDFTSLGVEFATNSSRPLALDGAVLGGEFYTGDILDSFVNLGWRPNRHIRSDTTLVYTDVDLPEGAFDFSIVRQRLLVALTPNVAANAFVQYNDFSELLSLNLRFNWIYRPGADLFVVFNQNWDAPGLSDLSSGDRALIVKFTYLFEL